MQRKTHRVSRACLDRFGNRIRPAVKILSLWCAPANLEIERCVNELKRFRFYATRGEQLQQPLAGANCSARVSAHVDDQSCLRKVRSGNDSAHFIYELIDYLAPVLDVEAEQPDVAVIAAGDGPRLRVKIFFECLDFDWMRMSKKSLLELIDFCLLDIYRGALLFTWLNRDCVGIRVVDPPFKAHRKYFSRLCSVG